MIYIKIKNFLVGTILVVGILCIPAVSFGELDLGLQEGDIAVSTIPENPEPYQDITIKLSSYSTDLNKANIVWQNNNKIVLSGIGETSYSFTALGPNNAAIFNVNITPEGSMTAVSKSIVIKTSEMDVLWESVDGYTPPFYRGKSFVSPEGFIKVVAIPNTDTIKSGRGKIVYSWKDENGAIQNASGYNKDSYVFENNKLNDTEKITVSASSVDSQYNATKNIEIPIVSPKLLFYKKSPTDGVLYNQALVDEATMSEDEMTLVAEPYFLATKGSPDSFDYKWQVNGSDIDTPSTKNELTVRPTERGGFATIGLSIENLDKLFQKVSNQLKLDI